jgi:hypothetical protein
MFFNISHSPKDNYTNQYKVGSFCIGTDNGWKTSLVNGKTIIYKGYVDCAPMDQLLGEIVEQSQPKFYGNFCALVHCPETDTIEIKSDLCRPIPVTAELGQQINNLLTLPLSLWTDDVITVTNDLNITQTKWDPIGEINEDRISEEEGLSILDSILTEKIQSFLSHNTTPLKVFLTGGNDTTLIYSYIKKFTDNFEFVIGSHFEWDRFYMKNRGDINQYWGFNAYHHWVEDTILATGGNGDEFGMRGPATCNMYVMNTEGGKILSEINTDPNNMHYTYFNRPANVKIFEQMREMHHDEYTSISRRDMIAKICNVLVNDWQHWHLGNTLTWTPLRDLRITKTILRMPTESIMGQILNGSISKNLIEKNEPGLTRIISHQKNSFNYYSNLYDYYEEQHKI